MQGEVIAGRFRIGKRLGMGGMGEVWAAQDLRMGRDVAVKLVHAFGAQGADTHARFRREVQLVARLSHRNIVTVHDWGEVPVTGPPVLYLVMELVHGASLRLRLKESRPSWQLAVGWAAQIAQALDAAHRHGVVHRDIKPANVLITPEGTVKVLDFGVAKFVGETLSIRELTTAGTLLGSPAYMSPEQAEGVRQTDHRCDLYSLGCLLYEALTGRPPFVSDSQMAVLHMQAYAVPVPPGTLVDGLPGELNDLVLRLLAKDPDHRPAGAAAVSDALTAILVDQALTRPGSDVLDLSPLGESGSVGTRILQQAWDAWRRTEAKNTDLQTQTAAKAEKVLDAARADAQKLRALAHEEAERILAEAWQEAETRYGAYNIWRRPKDRRPRFNSVRRGYDPREVGPRLDTLRDDLDYLWQQMGVVERRLRRITAVLNGGRDADGVWRATAERVIREAKEARQYTHYQPHEYRPEELGRFGFAQWGYDVVQVNEYLDELLAQQNAWLRALGVLETTAEEGERLLNRTGTLPE
ncbi:protein kinase [Streptomyces sp. NPDC020800]|uniref:serine/threonine-protein kinase n=1 Tax=Streptomyces sp. NPDC020800 TaxID=3365092 RepID=UPI0037A9A557